MIWYIFFPLRIIVLNVVSVLFPLDKIWLHNSLINCYLKNIFTNISTKEAISTKNTSICYNYFLLRIKDGIIRYSFSIFSMSKKVDFENTTNTIEIGKKWIRKKDSHMALSIIFDFTINIVTIQMHGFS